MSRSLARAVRLPGEPRGNPLPRMEPIPTMSWDDVHRLELQLRARAAAIGRRGMSPHCCPECGRAVDSGIQLGGLTVHEGCLPALRGAPVSV